MKKQDCYYLGKIVSKFSFKGEILLKLDVDEINSLNFKNLFIEIDNMLVPYSIDKISLHKSSLLRIKFDDIDSEEKANKLIKKECFMPLKDLPKLEGKKFYYHEIIGFRVLDKKLGHIGKVIQTNHQTSQPVLIINNNGREIMVPLVDEFLIELKRKEKIITFNLPDGLIDLYLE
jgi:16S rRNA processing protein RimM